MPADTPEPVQPAGPADFSDEQDRLDAWLATMWLELEVEYPEELPEGFDYSFGRDSLAELETLLLAEFATGEQVKAAENKEFVDRTARYIGETLRRSFDGAWQPGTGMYAGLPVVLLPDGTDFPESPFHLIDRVVLRRTGGELLRVYDGLTTNIARRNEP